MRSDLPNTRFSLSVKPRRGLTEFRVRAIVEASNGRRGPTSLSASILALLVCLLCVNLVSCVAVRADSGASSDTQAPAVQPEPSAIPAVLAGEKEYYSRVYGGFLDLAHLSRAEIPDYPEVETDLPCFISRFAVADLDGDGTLEALLEFSYGPYGSDRIAIFHERDGQVTVDFTNFKEMHPEELRADGIYCGAFGAGVLHYHRIASFTGDGAAQVESLAEMDLGTNSVNGAAYPSVDEMWSALDRIIGQSDPVTWHDFAGADFSLYFD